MTTATVDVVVVGGGIQGLVLLRELTADGYGCVMVTDAPLGSGQTLHSHGALITGMGLVTGGLLRTVQDVTVPYLRDAGVAADGDDPFLLAIPDSMVEQLTPAWAANNYHPEPGDPLLVPGLEPVGSVYRVPGYNVDRRRLVQVLAAGFGSRIVMGRIVADDESLGIRTATGDDLHLRANAVVVAAGCGSKTMLQQVFGVGADVTRRINYSKLHMICLKSPLDVLPPIGALVSPELLIVGHRREGGHHPAGPGVSWYVTPVDPSASAHMHAPDDAVAEIEPRVVALGAEALVRCYPALRQDDERLRATVFAGYKQEIDGDPLRRMCELVDADRNLVVAAPSVLANAVPNAFDVVAMLRQRVIPTGRVPDLPGTGAIDVADPYEDRGDDWQPWAGLMHTYVDRSPRSNGATDPSSRSRLR